MVREQAPTITGQAPTITEQGPTITERARAEQCHTSRIRRLRTALALPSPVRTAPATDYG
ncbi:hypothetical protein [Streptomyces sp. NPDC003077]|uniref:hypothetical protein n=1 Tax=Streptomyces sp. NPDC003077 TaxID=3154443 RepID=UPI0033AAD400